MVPETARVQGFAAVLHGVIGRRETGKTTLTMYLARRRPELPRFIFDPRNGIAARGDRSVKVYSVDALIDRAYPRLWIGELHEIIYTPRENDLRESFLAWSTLVQHHIEERPAETMSIVIDECALVKDELERMDHPMQAAMRWSRRDRVHFFLTCHQPKNLPTNTRAISDYLIFFHATQEHDLKVISERCSESFALDVSRLRPYHFLIWNDQLGCAMVPTIQPGDWKIGLAESSVTARAAAVPAELPSLDDDLDLGNLWR